MRHLRRFICLSLVIVLCITCLGGCQSNQSDSQPPTEENTQTEDTQQEETQQENTESDQNIESTEIILPDMTKINPLTGLADMTAEAMDKRPVAIMVNNVPKSFPQYGIEAADLIFEIPVEGGQTRFMAVYADYTQIPNVCSVRSARKYFAAIAKGFDAVYINWGRNDVIVPYLKSLKLTQYEGLFNEGKLFARDKERKKAGYALEHTGYVKGPKIPEALAKDKARVDIEEDKKGTAFNFYGYGEEVQLEGTTCTYAKIDYGTAVATFKYDATTDKYYKEYNKKAQIDGSTGNQLAFTNVFVLEAKIKADSNGLHRDVDWHGGNGYYLSNGIIQKIKWSKASEQEPLLLFDENGNELTINRGNSYFGISYIGEAKFE